jgi:hypothetical protein
MVSLRGKKINAKKKATVTSKMIRMSLFSVIRCIKKLATKDPFTVAIINAIPMLTPTETEMYEAQTVNAVRTSNTTPIEM